MVLELTMQLEVHSDLQSRFKHDETQNFEIVRVYREVVRHISCATHVTLPHSR